MVVRPETVPRPAVPGGMYTDRRLFTGNV